MAYYSSSCYGADDHGLGFYSTPYAENHDHYALDQGLTISYSSYEPTDQPRIQNFYGYYNDPTPTPYYHACHSTPTWPTISYSTSAFTNPISIIQQDPKFYGQSYDADVSTQFFISYSVSEFNEPEWDEYDPTPYGGGFDIVQTYGKPLPPSDETCYPLNGVTNGSIITPLGGKEEKIDEQAPKPLNGSTPIQAIEEEEQQHEKSNAGQPSQVLDNIGHETEEANATNPNRGEEIEESKGSDHEYNSGSGSYEQENQVYQVPGGSGLETMDICESLFGYWPCLYRGSNRGNGTCQEFSGEGSYGNPWKGAADYLFGSSNPYGDRRDEGSYYEYEGSIYAYERHYLRQPQNRDG